MRFIIKQDTCIIASHLLFYLFAIPISAPGCHQCYYGCGASDCQDWYDLGHVTSGVYHVTPCGTRFGYDVYCDMETDGGGWTVRRAFYNNYVKLIRQNT